MRRSLGATHLLEPLLQRMPFRPIVAAATAAATLGALAGAYPDGFSSLRVMGIAIFQDGQKGDNHRQMLSCAGCRGLCAPAVRGEREERGEVLSIASVDAERDIQFDRAWNISASLVPPLDC